MRVYYRAPNLLITERGFAVLAPRARTFGFDDLHDIHIVRGDLHPARIFVAHAAGSAFVVVAASWPLLIASPVACVAAGVLATTLSAACVTCGRLMPRCYELRATYLGLEVRLFCSSDSAAFGQVRRALVRALEDRRD
jgi:hypothetical protein